VCGQGAPLKNRHAMSQSHPIRIFVTHAWEISEGYLRVFEYLESANNFFYRNYSAPEQQPSGDKEAVKEHLRKQIAPTECVIALPELYERYQDLLTFELLYAQASNKPVVMLKRFGSNAAVPKPLADLANEVVDWDQRGLVDAVRRQARHEDTARDTIEFKID
jgi:hypothetical protein